MLNILPSGCKTQKSSEFYRHPGLALSAVGIYIRDPNDSYSEKMSYWIKTKTIEIDDEPYCYTISHTLHIGESTSSILRRMLKFSTISQPVTPVSEAAPVLVSTPAVKMKPANPAKGKVCVMCELLLSDEYAEQKHAANRFMLVLMTPYSLDSKVFAKTAESLHGRMRAYSAEDVRTSSKGGS